MQGMTKSFNVFSGYILNISEIATPELFAIYMLCLFVCFLALGPKSTAMVMAGRSVHLTTLFPGQA